ncbi:hypothetical protein B8W95_13740, partial [Staphylococcus pasteuri]
DPVSLSASQVRDEVGQALHTRTDTEAEGDVGVARESHADSVDLHGQFTRRGHDDDARHRVPAVAVEQPLEDADPE